MGMFRDTVNKVQSDISMARQKRAAKKEFFNAVLTDEREKARERASFAQATMLRTKAKKKAQFEAMPRSQRAKARLKKAGNFLTATRGVVQKVDASFTKAGKKFDAKAEKMNKGMALGGSLGESIFKK